MPALYAHNKYGTLVLNKLPKDIKKIVKQYPDAFKIGLQGPDFLFFYRCFCKNKVNQKGVFYHHNDIYSFISNSLEVVRNYGINSPQHCYILGFICHFVLDNTCHPYVNRAMKATGCGHVEIEGSLEHLLLTEDDYIPHSYPMHLLVPSDYDTAKSIAPFYEGLDIRTIHKSLLWMRRIKKLFVAPNIFKRTFLDLVLRASLHYKRFKGHILFPKANKKCQKQSVCLEYMLKDAVPDGVKLICDFESALEGGQISEEFHCDFNGNKY